MKKVDDAFEWKKTMRIIQIDSFWRRISLKKARHVNFQDRQHNTENENPWHILITHSKMQQKTNNFKNADKGQKTDGYFDLSDHKIHSIWCTKGTNIKKEWILFVNFVASNTNTEIKIPWSDIFHIPIRSHMFIVKKNMNFDYEMTSCAIEQLLLKDL